MFNRQQYWVHSAMIRTHLEELRHAQDLSIVQKVYTLWTSWCPLTVCMELSVMIGDSTFLEVAKAVNDTVVSRVLPVI